jgi:hypothetical protein
MEKFDRRRIIDFNNKISDVFNLLTITGNYKVIGSSSLKSILYNSDYDLDELIKSSKSKNIYEEIYKTFQQKFKEAEKDPNIFLVDFKCGVDINNEPVRWDKNDMKKGYKDLQDGSRLTFEDALKMKSVIKLDAIVLINCIFTEFSENYYLKIGNDANFEPSETNVENILTSIKGSFEDYMFNDINYLKALKRLFSYKILENETKNKKQLETLIEFFNSWVGLMSKNKSSLDILLLLLDNKFRKPKLEDIKKNLQIIKQSLSYITAINLSNVSKKIDYICSLSSVKTMKREIESLINFLFKIINKVSLDFISKNKNLLL